MFTCTAQKFSNLLFFSSVACLFLVLVGCGDGRGKRVPVAGVVKIDGVPVAHGSVTFFPVNPGEKSRPGGASLDENGRFQVTSYEPNDGLIIGNYEVTVMAIEPINGASQRWHAPQKYSVRTSSGLTQEITKESNEIEVNLTWEGDKHSKPFVEKM